jgi:hypothetical protein
MTMESRATMPRIGEPMMRIRKIDSAVSNQISRLGVVHDQG